MVFLFLKEVEEEVVVDMVLHHQELVVALVNHKRKKT